MLTARARHVLDRVSRWYRKAVLVLTPALHQSYGCQLSSTFRDVSAAAFRRRGWTGMLTAWSRMFGELIVVAPREHLSALFHNTTHSTRSLLFRTRRLLEISMSNFLMNIRVALRQLKRNPAFTSAALLTLALGIGANTAIFTVLHAVLLRPLDYNEPEELTAIWLEFLNNSGFGREIAASEPEFLEFRDQTQSFTSVSGYWTGEANLGGIESPERIGTASVTDNFLNTLGVTPGIGRGFATGDDAPGATPVVILTHPLWQRSFGADSSVPGRSVLVNGVSTTIIGVLPETFQFPGYDAQLLRPNVIDPANPSGRSSHYLSMVGRLRPGVALETARAETATLMRNWESQFPDRHGPTVDRHPLVIGELHTRLVGDTRPVIVMLTAAVAMVLLIACANVAGLMLARAESRQREMAVRTALGAGRTRLTTQLLTESSVLAGLGGAAGVALAAAGVRLIAAVGPAGLPLHAELGVNGPVLLFAVVVSLLAGVAFGLAPAISAGQTHVTRALRDGVSTSSLSRLVFRRVLIVAEIAVALVLAVGAGLLIRQLNALSNIDPGFRTDGVVTMRFALNTSTYPEATDVARFHRDLTERLSGLPGVTASGAVRTLPLRGQAGLETLNLVGRVRADDDVSWNTEYQVAGAGYFDALSIPVVMGRSFNERDVESSEPVVIINQRMAELFWPTGDALGKQIQVGHYEGNTNPIMTIVGVVGDVRQIELGAGINPTIFVPRQQAGAIYGGFVTRSATLVVRAETDPVTTMAGVQQVIRALDPNLPIASLQTMQDVVSGSISDERFTSFAMGLFSVIALTMGAIGVYGLMAYTVVQRTREIGVRIALGADGSRVQRNVIAQGLTLAGIGIAIGAVATVALAQLFEGLFVGLSARDPMVFAGAPLILIVAAALAAYLPARRAALVDPVDAIRNG